MIHRNLIHNALLTLVAGSLLTADFPWAERASAQSLPDDVGVTSTEGLDAYTPQSLPAPPRFGAILTRLLFGTVVSLVLCVATIWFGRRWLERGANLANPTQQHLQLTASLSLGRRCSVALLEIGDRQVLVGSDPSGLKAMLVLPVAFENVVSEEHADAVAAPNMFPLRSGDGNASRPGSYTK